MSEPGPLPREWIEALRHVPEPSQDALRRLRLRVREEGARLTGQRPARRFVAGAFAGMTATLAAAGLAWLLLPLQVQAPTSDGLIPVQFITHEPTARTVSLVGDFNGWELGGVPLESEGGGVWAAVVELEPGPVRYAFLIDGVEWRADINAAPAGIDFGRPTSITVVGGGEGE